MYISSSPCRTRIFFSVILTFTYCLQEGTEKRSSRISLEITNSFSNGLSNIHHCAILESRGNPNCVKPWMRCRHGHQIRMIKPSLQGEAQRKMTKPSLCGPSKKADSVMMGESTTAYPTLKIALLQRLLLLRLAKPESLIQLYGINPASLFMCNNPA